MSSLVCRALKLVCASAALSLTFTTAATAQYSTPVRDVENPARTPWVEFNSATFNNNFINMQISIGTLPAGQRLVLEYISVRCESDADDNISRVSFGVYKKTGAGWAQYYFPIPIQHQGNTFDGKAAWVAAQSLRLYSDSVIAGGTGHFIDVRHAKTANSTPSCSAFVSGYTLATP